MVNKVNKLPLKDVLAAIDMNAKNVWDELSDDERKQVSFYLLNRYVSAVKGSKQDKELQILKTNQYYNKNFFTLTKHKKLFTLIQASKMVDINTKIIATHIINLTRLSFR